MLQDIYYSRRSNRAVQVITQCRMLPDGTEAVCFQEMSGDYEVFVLAKEHFVKVFYKPDREEDDLKQAAVNETKENREEQGSEEKSEEIAQEAQEQEVEEEPEEPTKEQEAEEKPEKPAKEQEAKEEPEKTGQGQEDAGQPETEEEKEKEAVTGQPKEAEEEEIMDQPEEIVTQEEEAVSGIIRFLDAETYEDKMKVLESMRDDLDERTLNNMAVSLDLTIDNGVDAYSFLMSELRIRSRYEGKRGQRL